MLGWFTSRYTRYLESEVVRLRAENRALLNSALGIAGMAPLAPAASAPAATSPQELPRPESGEKKQFKVWPRTWSGKRAKLESEAHKKAKEMRKEFMVELEKRQREASRVQQAVTVKIGDAASGNGHAAN